MENKKNKVIYIVGIGGRTGSMFARELGGNARIFGVGMEAEAKAIGEGSLVLARNGNVSEVLRVPVVLPQDFSKAIEENHPDFIWLTVRNPVTEAVKFYYRHFRGKNHLPALVLSQNGLSAISDAKAALFEVLGHEADNVRIIRVSLLNGIDLKFEEPPLPEATAGRGRTAVIGYKLPIKLGVGAADGKNAADLKEIMRAGGINCQEFLGDKVFAMENSKLFTNLIGMAAAVNEMTVSAGLRDKEMFKKEAAMLREFILVAGKAKTGFASNFLGYPIEMLAAIMLWPDSMLAPLRGLFESIVVRGRNRPKDLGEIDYYNGEVVRLGKFYGVPTPANEEIVMKAKKLAAASKN